MEIYKLLPRAIWILWSGIWLISGINLFQGKGTHARKIKDMANGKNMRGFMRIQGFIMTALG